MIDFTIRSQGLNGLVINSSMHRLQLAMGISRAFGIQQERYNTKIVIQALTYNHEDGKISKLSEGQ